MWWWIYFFYLAYLIVFGAITDEHVFPYMLLWAIPDVAFIYSGYLFLLKKRPPHFAIQQFILLATIAVMILGFLVAPAPTEGNFSVASLLLSQLTFIPGLYVLWLLSFADGRVSIRDYGRSLPWGYKSDLRCWKISKYLYLFAFIGLFGFGTYFLRNVWGSGMLPFFIATCIFGTPLLKNNPLPLLFGFFLGLAVGVLSFITIFTGGPEQNSLLASFVLLAVSVIYIGTAIYFGYTIYLLTKEHYAKQKESLVAQAQ